MIFGYSNTANRPAPSDFSSEETRFHDGSVFSSGFQKVFVDHLEIGISGQILNLKQLYSKYSVSSLPSLLQEMIAKNEKGFHREFYGPFFIYIINKNEGSILFVNNDHQSSNLYYVQEGGGVYFSDQINLLLPRMSSVQPLFSSVRSFVGNGFTESDETQIVGIKKLLPSFTMLLCKGKIHLENFWTSEYSANRTQFRDLNEKIDQYESLFQENISAFISEKAPSGLGSLLSGGHDTSFSLIQTKKVSEMPLEAFTITFPGWNFSEEPYARNIADKFGARFNPVPFQKDQLDSMVRLIGGVEEPVVGVALPLQVLGENAKAAGIDALIGGDGGDTLWGEYYPVAEVHRYVKSLPLWGRRRLHKVVARMAELTGWERLWELEHVLHLFCQENFYKDFMQRLCTYRHFRNVEQKELFQADVYGDGSIAKSVFEVEFNESNFDEALIEGKLYNAFFTYMGFSQTKLFKSLGIDFFMPTVQRPIRDFITSLPMNWINGGLSLQRLTNSKSINRRFHKRALARYLKREEIYNRSFDIPWHSIFLPRPHVLECLKHSLKRRGWFQEKYLDNLFSEFEQQKVKDYELLELRHHGYRIFTLLSLEVWAKLYLDGLSRQTFSADDKLEDFLSSKI